MELLDFWEGGWLPLAWGFLRPLGTAAAMAATASNTAGASSPNTAGASSPNTAGASNPTAADASPAAAPPTGTSPAVPAPPTGTSALAPTPHALRPMPLRVQLFRWRPGFPPAAPGQADVWPQYAASSPEPYSSTVFLSILPIAPPAPLMVKYPFRPMAAHHQELGRLAPDDLFSARGISGAHGQDGGGYTGWGTARWPGRGDAPCLVPNTVLHALPGGTMGVTAVVFSPDGEFVVAAMADANSAALRVFDVRTGKQVKALHFFVPFLALESP